MSCLSIAISPCPNDTFIFYHLANSMPGPAGHDLEFVLKDVEELNRDALRAAHDITKLSFHAYLKVRDEYDMLSVGAALGFGCGPLVVSRNAFDQSELSSCSAVLPGELTTAHLLFRLWNSSIEDRRFVRYDRIFDEVISGRSDLGVVIHEGRFVYDKLGLKCIEDLGEWWTRTTGLPVPLGCIAVRKSLGSELKSELETLIRKSLETARKDPSVTLDYVRSHAQEMSDEVLQHHIETFVNDFSLDPCELGLRAIDILEQMADDAGMI